MFVCLSIKGCIHVSTPTGTSWSYWAGRRESGHGCHVEGRPCPVEPAGILKQSIAWMTGIKANERGNKIRRLDIPCRTAGCRMRMVSRRSSISTMDNTSVRGPFSYFVLPGVMSDDDDNINNNNNNNTLKTILHVLSHTQARVIFVSPQLKTHGSGSF